MTILTDQSTPTVDQTVSAYKAILRSTLGGESSGPPTTAQSHAPMTEAKRSTLIEAISTNISRNAVHRRTGYTSEDGSEDQAKAKITIHLLADRGANLEALVKESSQSFTRHCADTVIDNATRGEYTRIDGPFLANTMAEAIAPSHEPLYGGPCSSADTLLQPSSAGPAPSASELGSHLRCVLNLPQISLITFAEAEKAYDRLGSRPHNGHLNAGTASTSVRLSITPRSLFETAE